jgi:DnaJ-like protein
MSIEKHIDNMIKAAIERGEFDDLKGKGKPIDLDAYFAMPEDVRMGFSILKSNNFVPEEIDRLKEIAEIKEQIALSEDEEARVKLKKLLDERSLALSMILERNKRRK